jgi:hypothetical protein
MFTKKTHVRYMSINIFIQANGIDTREADMIINMRYRLGKKI